MARTKADGRQFAYVGEGRKINRILHIALDQGLIEALQTYMQSAGLDSPQEAGRELLQMALSSEPTQAAFRHAYSRQYVDARKYVYERVAQLLIELGQEVRGLTPPEEGQ